MKERVWCTCIMSYSGDRILLCLIGLKNFFLQLCYKIIINIYNKTCKTASIHAVENISWTVVVKACSITARAYMYICTCNCKT